MKDQYFWCDDHVAAAKAHDDLYPQYKAIEGRFSRGVLVKLKKNTGRRGYTWLRKGDITIGHISDDGFTAYSGHPHS